MWKCKIIHSEIQSIWNWQVEYFSELKRTDKAMLTGRCTVLRHIWENRKVRTIKGSPLDVRRKWALYYLKFTFASAKYLGSLPAWDHFAFEASGFGLPNWGHRSRWGWFTVISVSWGSVLLTGSVPCHHCPSGSHCNAKGQLNFASFFA